MRRRLSRALPGLREARAAPGFHASLLRGAPVAARNAEVSHMMSRGQAQTQELTAEIVGARFKVARVRAGLSVATTAERAGLKPARLRKIEAGKSAPRLTEMIELAKVVGLPLRDLLLSEDARHFADLLSNAPDHVRRGMCKVLEGVTEAYKVPTATTAAGTA